MKHPVCLLHDFWCVIWYSYWRWGWNFGKLIWYIENNKHNVNNWHFIYKSELLTFQPMPEYVFQHDEEMLKRNVICIQHSPIFHRRFDQFLGDKFAHVEQVTTFDSRRIDFWKEKNGVWNLWKHDEATKVHYTVDYRSFNPFSVGHQNALSGPLMKFHRFFLACCHFRIVFFKVIKVQRNRSYKAHQKYLG